MKSKIIKIGNSRGIRIPESLIDQLGLKGDIEIVVEGDRLIVSPVKQARAGWGSSFKIMAELREDRAIDGEEWEMSSP
jgi:antitoxin MazE